MNISSKMYSLEHFQLGTKPTSMKRSIQATWCMCRFPPRQTRKLGISPKRRSPMVPMCNYILAAMRLEPP